MKKSALLIALASLSLTCFAQKKNKTEKTSHLYARVGAAYAFPHAGQMNVGSNFLGGKVTNTYSSSTNISTTDIDIKKGSLGAGVTGVVAAGFMINEHLGLELGTSVGVAPKKYSFEVSSTYTSSGSTEISRGKSTIYQKMPVLIMPSIIVQSGGKLNVYTRVGLALPVAGKQIWEMESYYTDAGFSTNDVTVAEIKNRFAIGMQGALGVQVSLGQRLNFYVEANGVSLSAYAKHGVITKYESNGANQLPSMTTHDKEVDFEFQTTVIDPAPNTAAPQKGYAFSTPYSNIGVGAGLLIQF